MKIFYTCFLLIIMSAPLFTSFSFPVNSDTAKTICIITKDEDVAAFRTTGRILSSLEYDLEDSEEALMEITTEIMNKSYGLFRSDKIAIKLKAEISMLDSITIIKLTGNYLEKGIINSKLTEIYFSQYSNLITHGGTSSAASEAAWNYMMEVAQKYKNGKIRLQ